MVFKRHVFFLAGFDPFDVPALHRRFRREAATFETTWNVRASVSELTGEPMEQWAVSASGPNWSTQVIYEQLAWHDIVLADLAGPMLPRLRAGAETFWDFLVSGTVFRYFRANYRYGLFFLVPFVDVVLFALLALVAGGADRAKVPVAPVLAGTRRHGHGACAVCAAAALAGPALARRARTRRLDHAARLYVWPASGSRRPHRRVCATVAGVRAVRPRPTRF